MPSWGTDDKLTKPAVGSTGWGDAVNQNFQDIMEAFSGREDIESLKIENTGWIGISSSEGIRFDDTNDEIDILGATLDMNTHKITNVVDPTTDQEAATKKYVDDAVAFVTAYICVVDEKTAGTAGGGFTSGAWRTRDLNTERADTGGHASLSSNQITLAAGTYVCRITAPCWLVRANKARLYNVTDASVVLVGTSEYNYVNSSDHTYSSSRSVVTGSFVLAAQKTLRVEHRCSLSRGSDGFGVASNFGVVEVYTEAELWKIG